MNDRRSVPRFRRLLLACGVLAAVAVGARIYLLQRAEGEIDGSPLPRPLADAPFITTPENVVEKMLELAQIQKDSLLYDLGCGDGRIVIAAAKKYGCRAVGIDKDPERVRESRENAKHSGVEGLVTIRQEDILALDLSQADAVTLYLLPQLNLALIPQLEKLKTGARIVSHDWDLGSIRPNKVVEVVGDGDPREHTLYLWVAPLRRSDP